MLTYCGPGAPAHVLVKWKGKVVPRTALQNVVWEWKSVVFQKRSMWLIFKYWLILAQMWLIFKASFHGDVNLITKITKSDHQDCFIFSALHVDQFCDSYSTAHGGKCARTDHTGPLRTHEYPLRVLQNTVRICLLQQIKKLVLRDKTYGPQLYSRTLKGECSLSQCDSQ